MSEDEISKAIAAHKKWLDSIGREGECADLRDAHLMCADLRDAKLRGAKLGGAKLGGADLYRADLRYADLRYADLQSANLQDADLRYADLHYANLRGADLQGADLRGADLDFSCLPLWCGSLKCRIDERIAAQLMYHAMRVMRSVAGDADVAKVLANADCIRLANRFHRVTECGKIEKTVTAKD